MFVSNYSLANVFYWIWSVTLWVIYVILWFKLLYILWIYYFCSLIGFVYFLFKFNLIFFDEADFSFLNNLSSLQSFLCRICDKFKKVAFLLSLLFSLAYLGFFTYGFLLLPEQLDLYFWNFYFRLLSPSLSVDIYFA